MELTSLCSTHSFIMGEIYVMPIIQIASFRSMPSIVTFLQINSFFLCVRLAFCCKECLGSTDHSHIMYNDLTPFIACSKMQCARLTFSAVFFC